MLIPFLSNTNILNNIDLFIPIITSFIIAPHGMTDLIHAEENNKQKQVHLTYISCLISGLFLNNANSQIFDALFLIVSIIHFSHDLPFKNRLIQILLSSIFVLDLEKIDFSFFIYYMIFIHVPNHYNRFEKLLKKYKKKSFTYIFGTGLLIFILFQNNPNIVEQKLVLDISKCIIVGHIIYEELYAKEKFNHFQI
tara:strand:- start:50 stop:634 length:585 start_codon:yes stop_codon:yes gene_type:complete